MAVYTPKNLIANKAFGNGSGAISTWSYQASAVTGIVRTITVNTPTAARTVTLQSGVTQADTTAERFLDAYALTANVPYILNFWRVIPASSFLDGFANSTDINGAADGYEYV